MGHADQSEVWYSLLGQIPCLATCTDEAEADARATWPCVKIARPDACVDGCRFGFRVTRPRIDEYSRPRTSSLRSLSATNVVVIAVLR